MNCLGMAHENVLGFAGDQAIPLTRPDERRGSQEQGNNYKESDSLLVFHSSFLKQCG